MWWDRLQYSWRSEIGLVRNRNEDAVAVHPELGLIVVADGVGGSNSGDVASGLAADVITGRFQRQAPRYKDPDKARLFVEAAVEEANLAIWDWSQQHKECVGMGTTVVAGWFGEKWLAFAYVGDSRLYRLRDGLLTQLSRDHSFIQEVVDQGFFRSLEDAKHYGISNNILTRALGSSNQVKASSDVTQIHPGDLFLSCTDGLTGMIPDTWLEKILKTGADQDLDTLADTLVKIAYERGASDNITLCLVRAPGEFG
jgi:serine/threonine protein phosphatase PrpC